MNMTASSECLDSYAIDDTPKVPSELVDKHIVRIDTNSFVVL
jgi:hypothetical protein